MFKMVWYIMIIKIIRKGRLVSVIPSIVGELDKSKLSKKFLELNLPDDAIVNVKCNDDGTIDFRGKKEEYRIIVAD